MSNIIQENVSAEMGQSFIDYAMSVITDRALPDVRDGMKPVHRRILYAMHEAGNHANKPYRKSARMVGDVIGKYHPHSDTAVYDAAVRMAQTFTMRDVLIDGQGNFGSMDGDGAAAMRYTEMRLSKLGGEFFGDIAKETVDWRANYDGKEMEPATLPVPFPSLLVNGVNGIAVGMASAIPPHNLRAVVDASLLLMERPDASVAEVIDVLKAPDFPTGALVHGLDGFADAVETGRGIVKLRSKWHEEDRGRGAKAIVLDEIPFAVCKAELVKRIADLVKDKKVEDIVELRDESSKEGVRVYIGLKKDASPEAIFAELASKTDVEISVSYNCVVLVDGKPRQLGLREIISQWIGYRREVVLKRYIYERKQAQARLHILAGFMAALSMLDQTIATIRNASSPADARAGLVELLSIDEDQAQAILDLRLQKLTGMELDAIRLEHTQVTAKVAELTEVIESSALLDGVIRGELSEIARKYGSDRLTEIGHGISEITREDLIPREDVLLAMTQGGYIKRLPVNALERQNRGTRGKKTMEVGEDDNINFMKQCHSHDSLMVFAQSGQVYGIKAYRIPEGSMTNKGRHIKNVIDGLDEPINTVLALPEHDDQLSVLTVTRSGQVKRSAIDDYSGATRRGGIRGVGIDEDDSLVGAFTVRDGDHIMLVANSGKAIRFEATDVRVVGRGAGGVRGIKLDDGEFVVGAAIVANGAAPELYMLCVGANGVGKRTPVEDFPVQGRAGGGVIAFKANEKTGQLVSAMGVKDDQDLIMFASNGVSNRVSMVDIRVTGRAASGVILMNLDEGHTLVSATTTLKQERPDSTDQPEAADAATPASTPEEPTQSSEV